jgi:hypothetical protein
MTLAAAHTERIGSGALRGIVLPQYDPDMINGTRHAAYEELSQ